MKDIFREIRTSLSDGVNSGHPYHLMVMGSVGLDRMARLRTVVLRKVTDDLSLWCYTDRRSKKVMHVIENSKISLLFYDPNTQVQLKVEGLAELIEDPEIIKTVYADFTEKMTKEYRTKKAPGSTLASPEEVDYLDEDHHLCILATHPYKIEYLRLGDPDHLRIRFTRTTSGEWEGEYLTP